MRNLSYLGLGLLAAVAGIWIFSSVDLALVQGMGFLLLAPAGTFMAVGLCRLWEEGCRSGKLALPAIPAPLRRSVSFRRGDRSVLASLSRSAAGRGRGNRDSEERRPVSWAE